jgi:purine-binding chemotaxis protein CheW
MSDGDLQFVLFEIEGVRYGVEVENVLEVITRPEVSQVPSAQDFVQGVINLRGKVLPVMDLRRRFRLGGDAARSTHIVIMQLHSETAGIAVDGVSQVVRIPVEAIEPPPAAISGPQARYVVGIAKLPEFLVVLLDLQKAFEESDIAIDAANHAAVGPGGGHAAMPGEAGKRGADHGE